MKFPALLAFAFFSVASLPAVTGQTPDPPRKVRFMAVGELPPFQQEVREGIRYELEPPAGSIPPREVSTGFEGGEAASTPLTLGRITAGIKAPAGVGPLLLRKRESGPDTEPWLRVPCPEKGDFLVLLWRDPQRKTWDAARSIIFSDDPVAYPAGSMRIVNVSQVSANIVVGEEKLILLAGKSILRSIPAGAEIPFQVVITDTTGNLRPLYSTTLRRDNGERGLAVIYQADGANPRRPLKVTIQREPTPLPPPAPAKP